MYASHRPGAPPPTRVERRSEFGFARDRTRRALLALVTAVGGQALVTAAGFVSTPIILGFTSEALYGYWLTLLSLLGFLAITDLGLGTSFAHLVAALSNADNTHALNRVVSTAFVTYCAAAALFITVGETIVPWVPRWFRIPQTDLELVITTYRIALVGSALFLPLSTFAGVVLGLQRMAVANVTSSVIRVLSIGLSIVLLHAGMGLPSLSAGILFSVLVDGVWLFVYARRCFPQLAIRLSLVNRSDFARLISYGGYFQMNRVATAVAQGADSLVIAAQLGAASVTPYALTSRLAVLFSVTISGKLADATFPGLSQMFASPERHRLVAVTARLAEYSVRLAVVASAFFAATNPAFVGLWVGSEYYAGATLNTIFAGWVMLDTIIRGLTPVVLASDDLQPWAFMSLAEAVINVCLSLLLVGPLGLVGVALGTLVAKATTTAWYLPYAACKTLHLPISAFLSEAVMRPLVRSVPGVVMTIGSAAVIPIEFGWWWIALVGVSGAAGNLLFFEGVHYARTGGVWRKPAIAAVPTEDP